jgi:hypothetical protein
MSNLLLSLLYLSVFVLISLGGYQLYKVLNNKIKEAQTGWQLAGFSVLLFLVFALLLVGGLYIFIELYAFLAKPQP